MKIRVIRDELNGYTCVYLRESLSCETSSDACLLATYHRSHLKFDACQSKRLLWYCRRGTYMNQAIFITRVGPPDSLELRDVPMPSLQPDQVLLQAHAVGVNFADVVARRGMYPDAPKRPFVPGYEVAGTIQDIGQDVECVAPGQRVVAMTHFGAYARVVAVPANVVLPMPEGMPFVDAAAMPLNFTTAYHSLFHTGLVHERSRVLIHAAAGGVGLAAVQFAQNAGAEVFGTAGSQPKIDFLREFGVQHAINYRKEDFAAKVMQLTQNEGLDIILDSVGGGQLRKDLRLLRANGRLVSLGVASLMGKNKLRVLLEILKFPRPNTLRLLQNSQGVYGVNLNKLIGYPDLLRSVLQKSIDLYAQGVVKPVIAQTFPFEQAAAAHRMMENRGNIGKIVLTFPSGESA